jgi:hypothetical protein
VLEANQSGLVYERPVSDEGRPRLNQPLRPHPGEIMQLRFVADDMAGVAGFQKTHSG